MKLWNETFIQASWQLYTLLLAVLSTATGFVSSNAASPPPRVPACKYTQLQDVTKLFVRGLHCQKCRLHTSKCTLACASCTWGSRRLTSPQLSLRSCVPSAGHVQIITSSSTHLICSTASSPLSPSPRPGSVRRSPSPPPPRRSPPRRLPGLPPPALRRRSPPPKPRPRKVLPPSPFQTPPPSKPNLPSPPSPHSPASPLPSRGPPPSPAASPPAPEAPRGQGSSRVLQTITMDFYGTYLILQQRMLPPVLRAGAAGASAPDTAGTTTHHYLVLNNNNEPFAERYILLRFGEAGAPRFLASGMPVDAKVTLPMLVPAPGTERECDTEYPSCATAARAGTGLGPTLTCWAAYITCSASQEAVLPPGYVTDGVVFDPEEDMSSPGSFLSTIIRHQPSALTSLTALMGPMCGVAPSLTQQQLQNAWWGPASSSSSSSSSSTAPSLEHMLNSCSNGYQTMEPALNHVLGPVPLACTGTLADGTTRYDFSTACGRNELGAVWEAVVGAIQSHHQLMAMVLPVRHPQRFRLRHKLLLLPALPTCTRQWQVSAPLGCVGTLCINYIVLGSAGSDTLQHTVQSMALHALLHNLNIQHATMQVPTAIGPVTGVDPSDMMYGSLVLDAGQSPGAFTCPSVPMLTKLGWATPVQGPASASSRQLANAAYEMPNSVEFQQAARQEPRQILPALETGRHIELDLLAASNGERSYAQVWVGRRIDDDPAVLRTGIYFSYHVRAVNASQEDSGLPHALSRQVLVHSYDGLGNYFRDGPQFPDVLGVAPQLLALLSPRPSAGNASNMFDPFTQVSLPGVASALPVAGAWSSPLYQVNPSERRRFVVRVLSASTESARIAFCVPVGDEGPGSCADNLDNDCDGMVDSADPGCADYG